MALFIWERPSQLLDQHFGLEIDPEDLLLNMVGARCPVMTSRTNYCRPQRCVSRSTSRNDTGSKIAMDKDAFKVTLDVQQFSPSEISVKASGRELIVEGSHDEKQDELGSVSRHFVRKYILPEGHMAEDIVSSLSSDGQLTITAPRKVQPDVQERVVPITFTEKPHKEKKEAEKKAEEAKQVEEAK